MRMLLLFSADVVTVRHPITVGTVKTHNNHICCTTPNCQSIS